MTGRASGVRGSGRALAAALLCAWLPLAFACKSPEERRAQALAEAEERFAAGKPREALILLRKALQANPQDAEINFRIAELLESEDHLPDAAFFYGETWRLDPSRTEAAVREARLLIFDEPARVAEILAEVLERDPANSEAHIVLSRRSIIDRDLDTALRHALTATELEPGNAAAHLQLAKVRQAKIREAQFSEEETEEELFRSALASLDRAVALEDEQVTWRAHGERAKVLAAWPGHQQEAPQAHRDAVSAALELGRTADIAEALQAAQKGAVSLGDTELLAWALEKRVELDPTDVSGWMGLASITQSEGGDGSAVLQRMLEALPDDPVANYQYARFLATAGRVDDAVAHLEGAIARGVDPPQLLASLDRLLREHQRPEQAAAVYDRMVSEYPGHPDVVVAQAQQAMLAGRLEEAEVALRELAGREERQDALLMLAQIQHRLGKRGEALDAADRAFQLNKRGQLAGPALRLRSQLHAELGNCREALGGFTGLARRDIPLLLPERIMQANCLYRSGRPDLGRKVYENLLKERPLAFVVVEYAQREAARDPERIRTLLEETLERNPGEPRVLTALGRMDFAEGQPRLALDRLNGAIETGKAGPAVRLERARVLLAFGEYEAAQRDALLAFESQPDLPGASALLVRIYSSQGRIDEAISSFEEAYAVGALRPPARILLGRLHMVNGNEARAREILEEVLAENDELPAVKNDLAYLLAKQSTDLDRALQLAQEAQQSLGREPQVAHTVGFVYLQRGLSEPALEQFRFALVVAEKSGRVQPVYHYHAGLALQNLGRTDEAASEFQAALALDEGYEEAADALRAMETEETAASEKPSAS